MNIPPYDQLIMENYILTALVFILAVGFIVQSTRIWLEGKGEPTNQI